MFGYYLIGAALDETSGYAEGPRRPNRSTMPTSRRECPRLAAAAPYFKRPSFDSTFELGFELILEGIADSREALLARARARAEARGAAEIVTRSAAPVGRAAKTKYHRPPFPIRTLMSQPQRGSIFGSIVGILICGVAGGFAAWMIVSSASASTAWPAPSSRPSWA